MSELSSTKGFNAHPQNLPENAGILSSRSRVGKGLAGAVLAATGIAGLAGCTSTGTPEKAPTTTTRVPAYSETYPPALADQNPGDGSSNPPALSNPTGLESQASTASSSSPVPSVVKVASIPANKPWVKVSGQCDNGSGITITSGNFAAGAPYHENIFEPDGSLYDDIINGGNAHVQSDGRLTAIWPCYDNDPAGEWKLYVDAAGKDNRFDTSDDQRVAITVQEFNGVRNNSIFTTAG